MQYYGILFSFALFWFVFLSPFFPFPFLFPFVLVLVLGFGFGFGFGFPLRLCAFAPLRSLLQPFPFEPLRSRSRVSFLWVNRKSERFGEAVHGVGCRSGVDGMRRLSIAEDFTQTSDVRIGDLGRFAGKLLGKVDGLDQSRR
jgi:hypothetical protein